MSMSSSISFCAYGDFSPLISSFLTWYSLVLDIGLTTRVVVSDLTVSPITPNMEQWWNVDRQGEAAAALLTYPGSHICLQGHIGPFAQARNVDTSLEQYFSFACNLKDIYFRVKTPYPGTLSSTVQVWA